MELSFFDNNSLYKELYSYVNEHEKMSLSEFDSVAVKDVCLFNMPNNEQLSQIEATLDQIIKALPSFKRIFSRPIIRLKDEHHIVPVESVKVIDNRSLTHIASRCEMWEDVTKDGIKPRKLLTIEHVETYSIYENIAFAYAVDSIFEYISKALACIKDIAYSFKNIHFNMLDRTYHKQYFLAIGKLYLEYVSTNISQSSCLRCIDKMVYIDKTLRQKLKSPVYQHCRQKSYSIKLKRTNIFRSHKDYKEVHKILKLLNASDAKSQETEQGGSASSPEYKAFCKLLTIFAINHFNYEIPKDALVDLSSFSLSGSFSDWNLNVQFIEDTTADALVFKTKKDAEFVTCLIFCKAESLSKEKLNDLKKRIPASEYYFCRPNAFGDANSLSLNIYDIDSFSRIQQILFRGMILSDKEHNRCAFCGGLMSKSDNTFTCSRCLSEITENVCPETGKIYFVSDISGRKSNAKNEAQTESERRKFLHDRLSEAQLHFRNITPITKSAEPVCPHCKKVHV